jgi:hypothetical protein
MGSDQQRPRRCPGSPGRQAVEKADPEPEADHLKRNVGAFTQIAQATFAELKAIAQKGGQHQDAQPVGCSGQRREHKEEGCQGMKKTWIGKDMNPQPVGPGRQKGVQRSLCGGQGIPGTQPFTIQDVCGPSEKEAIVVGCPRIRAPRGESNAKHVDGGKGKIEE